MNHELLQQANYILDSCGRPQPLPGESWVDLPAHIGYTRFMTGGASPFPGSEDSGGVMHKGRVPFILRAITAQALPRNSQGIYWRLRLPDGKYLHNQMTGHGCGFGFGSDRLSLSNEIEWRPGDKLFVDLDTILSGPPPVDTGYTVAFMFEGVYRFPISGPGAVRYPLTVDRPRYFANENQNILAPEYRFGPGCPSETPVGFEDSEYCYATPTADLPITGAVASNVTMQIQTDSDFICRQIWPYFPTGLSNQGTGQVITRLRRGDGYVLMSNFVPILSIQGPMFKELRVKAGDSIYYDAKLINGAGTAGNVVTFGMYLYGVKRKRIIG